MKKSLIALAVLAASGAAMAQSSVTLYGIVDAGFGTSKAGVGAASVTQTTVFGSGLNNSRWGLKGSEDLGGGLKANFVLENGFSTDTGNTVSSTQAFSRAANVGLSGSFGAVTLGRNYTAYDDLRGATNMHFDTNLATTGTVWGRSGTTLATIAGTTNTIASTHSSVADYSSRVDNSIAFRSDVYGGVSGALVTSLGENKGVGVGGVNVAASRNVSMHVKYAAGPLLVGVAYQTQKAQNGTTTLLSTGTADTNYTLIAGSYDFGIAKVTGGYNIAKAKATNTEDKEYQLGVSVPLSAVANVSFGYSSADGEVNGVDTTDAAGYSVMGYYDLSKRTRLYAGLNRTKAENAANVDTDKTSVAVVGVKHTF